MQSVLVTPLRRALAVVRLLSVAAGSFAAEAAVLTSSDGKTRDFPVVVSAARAGLTVRETTDGKNILIPWARLDEAKSAGANPWFKEARATAAAGGTVVLNLGLSPTAEAAPAAMPDPASAEWRRVKATVPGGGGKNFGALKLSAYVHRDVAVPRLAIVWVGASSPLAKRGDAADLARRMQGALVVAEFDGAYASAGEGSGEALVAGVADLLKQARPAGAKNRDGAAGTRGKEKAEAEPEEDTADPKDEEAATPGEKRAGPALIVIGRDEAATFVWSLVCTRPDDVLAAITLNGVHKAESTAGAFATPCLFLESSGVNAGEAARSVAEDLTRPHALWRHFSTDGCRWCHAAPAGDPLTLAVAFARSVAEASPYVEALELLESWESNTLRHRIPMPVKTAKHFKEDAFRLATPNGASVYSVASKSGVARNDLVWVPSASFAAQLGGR